MTNNHRTCGEVICGDGVAGSVGSRVGKAGFTLIELLVVISIIALLVALLFYQH